MIQPGNIRTELLVRLDALISEGEKLPMHTHTDEAELTFDAGSVERITSQRADQVPFEEWITSCSAALDIVIPKNSVLRDKLEKFGNLKNYVEEVDFGRAFLKAVRREFDLGMFDSFFAMIEKAIIFDFVSQAESVFEGNNESKSYIPAAVLIGAVLERKLRSMCGALVPPILTTKTRNNGKEELLTMGPIIDALKGRGSFNDTQAAHLRAWATIRNKAAHGHFTEFNVTQVEQMIVGIKNFLDSHN